MPDEVPEERLPMRQRMTDAINEAISSEGEFVTKFVCMVEVIDSDGDTGLWAVTSENINSWDILGMLMWGLQHEQAGKTLRIFGQAAAAEEDDDD